ncbi:MAG: hypothetical protein KDK65_04580, partial [Chlamydiia bacterium]|nr:hypothetical protein [Chlamydiia bacterium]
QFAINLIRDPRYIKKETGAGSGGVFFLTLTGEKIFVLREGSIQAPPVLNEYASCYVSGRLIRYALFSGDDKDGNPVEGMITEVFPNVGSFHALLDLFRLKDIEIVPDDPELQSSVRSFTEKFALCQRLGIEHDKTPMDMRLWNHIDRRSFLDGLLFEVICVNTDLNYGNLLIQRKENEQIHIQFIDWEKCFPRSYPDDFIDFDISVKTDMGGTILQTPVPSKFKDLLRDQWINGKIAFLERNLKLSQEGIAVFKAHCLFVRTAAKLRCNIDIVYSIFTDVLGEPPCNRVCSWHRQAFSQIDGDDEKKWLEFCRLCHNELSERMKQPMLLK